MAKSLLFSAKNLSLDYMVGDQLVNAVKTCNIDIPENGVTIIYGASGSGKSSLLNIISGLQAPSKGKIAFRGDDIYGQSQNELAYFRAHELGIVYQTNYWVKSLSVIENVALPLYFLGESKLTAHKKAHTALSRVNMDSFANKYPILLSGGEQQRIAMARAIINDPPVIIADEPTGNLDSKNGDLIIGLLRELHQKDKKTIVLVTHNMEYLSIANHLLEIQDGQVIQIDQKRIPATVKTMLSDTQKRISNLMNGGSQ